MNSNASVFIYGLVDPRTDEIRYVGWATIPEDRYNDHLSESVRGRKIHKCNWIRQLLSLNLKPKLIILDEVSAEDYSLCESAWIMYGLEQDWPLTNMTLGGDGSLGCVPSEETRIKIGKASKNRSKESNKKISEGNKGKKLSAAHKEAISKKLTGLRIGNKHPLYGKHHSEETREKMSRSQTGRKHSNEIKEKIRAGNTGKVRSDETRNRISEAKKNPSEETRKRISESKKGNKYSLGRILSEETKQKIRDAQKGSGHSQAILNEDIVLEIRHLYNTGMRICNIEKVFNIKYATVQSVVYRKTWKHI